jgi:hypothetical protein
MKKVEIGYLLYTLVLVSVFSGQANAATDCNVQCSRAGLFDSTKVASITCEYEVNRNFGYGFFRIDTTYDCRGNVQVGDYYGGGTYNDNVVKFCQKLGCSYSADSEGGTEDNPSVPGFLTGCTQNSHSVCTSK